MIEDPQAEIDRLTAKVAQLYEGAEKQKQHIKRLEEALEECDWAFTKFCPEHESRYGDAWEKVRDALNRPNPFKPYWQEAKP